MGRGELDPAAGILYGARRSRPVPANTRARWANARLEQGELARALALLAELPPTQPGPLWQKAVELLIRSCSVPRGEGKLPLRADPGQLSSELKRALAAELAAADLSVVEQPDFELPLLRRLCNQEPVCELLYGGPASAGGGADLLVNLVLLPARTRLIAALAAAKRHTQLDRAGAELVRAASRSAQVEQRQQTRMKAISMLREALCHPGAEAAFGRNAQDGSPRSLGDLVQERWPLRSELSSRGSLWGKLDTMLRDALRSEPEASASELRELMLSDARSASLALIAEQLSAQLAKSYDITPLLEGMSDCGFAILSAAAIGETSPLPGGPHTHPEAAQRLAAEDLFGKRETVQQLRDVVGLPIEHELARALAEHHDEYFCASGEAGERDRLRRLDSLALERMLRARIAKRRAERPRETTARRGRGN